VDVSLLRVVDLTASGTLKALDVTEEELHTEDCRSATECYPILAVASRRAASFQLSALKTRPA
jgi:hypothetical protein